MTLDVLPDTSVRKVTDEGQNFSGAIDSSVFTPVPKVFRDSIESRRAQTPQSGWMRTEIQIDRTVEYAAAILAVGVVAAAGIALAIARRRRR